MKVYVYQTTKKNRLKFYAKEIDSDYGYLNLIGTLDLPIDPVKKEVVKEVSLPERYLMYLGCIPENAYDIKVVYKVKE